MDTQTFCAIAIKGFTLGFSIGFTLWALSYAARVFRKSVMSGMRVFD